MSDDVREALAQVLWNATRAQSWEDFMPTVMTDMGSCLHVADALIAAGYQKVEVTADMVERATETLISVYGVQVDNTSAVARAVLNEVLR